MKQKIRLGIAGLGVVGAGVIKILNENQKHFKNTLNADITIAGITARDKHKNRDIKTNHIRWYDDPCQLAKSDTINTFIECIGGEDGIAKNAVETALNAGKHVITANKALLAKYGVQLAHIAEQNNVALNFEAAVIAAIPIVKIMRENLIGNTIRRVYGIMNGTCNFILSNMLDNQMQFEDALKKAQELGFAEADPTFDITGTDTAHKLAILTSLAYGCTIDAEQIYLEGIEHITLQDCQVAQQLGYKIKLLGVCLKTEEGIEQRVHPALVPLTSPVAEINGAYNAVVIESDYAEKIVIEGQGAGQYPTASSIIADILDIARNNIPFPLARPTQKLKPYQKSRMRTHEGSYYIVLELYDKVGQMAAVTKYIAEENISIETILQHDAILQAYQTHDLENQKKPSIIITNQTSEAAVKKLIERIHKGGHTTTKPRFIRIETF